MSSPVPTVYVVDDEVEARESMGWVLRSRRILWEGYASADAFEAAIDAYPLQMGGAEAWPGCASCVLLDVGMPGTSGLVLFERLRNRGMIERMPVIFLTGHGDVAMAVAALQRGAFDFIEKPAAAAQLVSRIDAALASSREHLRKVKEQALLRQSISVLTRREREVAYQAVLGQTNGEIAESLRINIRTVETHRAAAFAKLGARSPLELLHRLRQANTDPVVLIEHP
ncbi:response regulator transcription factor [Piscinibacter sp. HJYY11]|uniref:response regulator transcription factor n=1 Tax=Piscinibacter sp. HJYY11 TaxID=2801333 RepID=UPI00191DCAD6|nr:response regulator [Piscinibacter sp. HJYY11]MBL0729586.1 response regulator transcription factor [Piscinibacter sp. HJYY11]